LHFIMYLRGYFLGSGPSSSGQSKHGKGRQKCHSRDTAEAETAADRERKGRREGRREGRARGVAGFRWRGRGAGQGGGGPDSLEGPRDGGAEGRGRGFGTEHIPYARTCAPSLPSPPALQYDTVSMTKQNLDPMAPRESRKPKIVSHKVFSGPGHISVVSGPQHISAVSGARAHSARTHACSFSRPQT